MSGLPPSIFPLYCSHLQIFHSIIVETGSQLVRSGCIAQHLLKINGLICKASRVTDQNFLSLDGSHRHQSLSKISRRYQANLDLWRAARQLRPFHPPLKGMFFCKASHIYEEDWRYTQRACQR